MVALKVGEAGGQATEGMAGVSDLVSVQISVLPIISVWEFCQKSWACGSFCSLVSFVV